MDIFEFWHDVGAAERIHPNDRAVFDRLPQDAHGFQLDCLPGPFKGPLRTTPVVLLFLSPGFKDLDREHAATAEGQAYYARSRTGTAPLPSKEDHPASYEWSTRVLRQFGVQYEEVREEVAFLNIGAYKSNRFDDWHMLAALPSCRIAIDWAQAVLFPEAEAAGAWWSVCAVRGTGAYRWAATTRGPSSPPSIPGLEPWCAAPSGRGS